MDAKQVTIAATALKKFLSQQEKPSEKKNLLDDDSHVIYLVVKNKKYFSEIRASKPKTLKLPHSIWGKDQRPSICLFSRDPQRAYKDALANLVDRVVGVSKLKGKFKPYEARRELKKSFDLFLAEEEVVPMLPKLLGKTFFSTQFSVPVPITVRKKDSINAEKAGRSIDKIVNSTVIIIPASTILLVRIGTTDLTAEQLAENAKTVTDYIAEKLPKGMESILSLGIKTNGSPLLPVYYAKNIYSEDDIGASDDENYETEGKKRAREDAELDALLKEVADDEEIAEYNRDVKRRRKLKTKGQESKPVESESTTEK